MFSSFIDFKNKILNCDFCEDIVIVADKEELSWKDLISKSCSLAKFFESKGVKSQDKIVVQLPNSIEFILCYFASILGNYIIVPVSSSLLKKEVEYIISATKPKLIIKDVKELDFSLYKGLCFCNSDENSIIGIFFTSGTTSRPKAVCHSLGKMFQNAINFNRLVGLDENVRMFHIMPMYYMAGFLNTILCPILAGGTVCLGSQFNASSITSFWKELKEYKANAIWMTPTIVALLIRLNRDKQISLWTKKYLKYIFVGTAPLLNKVKISFEETFNVECLNSYGMTELLLVAGNIFKNSKDNSVGKLINGVEVQIRDQSGEVLPMGEEGELFIKTSFALKGYLDSENDKIVSPLKSGWFETGDYGYIDTDSNLFITGRIKDLIIKGGINISPRVIENVLLNHSGIEDVAVVGIDHPFWGEEVCAFIIMQMGSFFIEEEFKDYCKQYLNVDFVPTKFKVIDKFPKSSIGKVQKDKLKELVLL